MLQLNEVEARYGSFKALEKVSMTVGEGELVVLLGANGAGKAEATRDGEVGQEVGGEVGVDGEGVLVVVVEEAHPGSVVGVGVNGVAVPQGLGVAKVDLRVKTHADFGFAAVFGEADAGVEIGEAAFDEKCTKLALLRTQAVARRQRRRPRQQACANLEVVGEGETNVVGETCWSGAHQAVAQTTHQRQGLEGGLTPGERNGIAEA